MLSISREDNEETNIDDLLINTVQKDDFVFKCYDANEIVSLVNYILQTIKKNSIYAVVVQVISLNSASDRITVTVMVMIFVGLHPPRAVGDILEVAQG